MMRKSDLFKLGDSIILEEIVSKQKKWKVKDVILFKLSTLKLSYLQTDNCQLTTPNQINF